jgi:pilus assembly protein CpaF
MLAGFAGYQGSEVSLRRQIANALDFIVQIGRMSNGHRRILTVTEVIGLSDSVITTQDLYRFVPAQSEDHGELDSWVSSGIHPHSPKLAHFRQELRNFSEGFDD